MANSGHPKTTRDAVLRAVASGTPQARVAADWGVPPATVASWVKRYGLPPTKPTPRPLPEEEEEEEPGEGGGWRPGPRMVSTPARPLHDADLPRADFLRKHLDEVDSDLELCRDAGAFASLRALHSERSAAHKELSDIVRNEGSRLDLTRDPRAVAQRLQAMEQLLRVLSLDLDGDPAQ